MFFKGVFILIVSVAVNLAIAKKRPPPQSRCDLASEWSRDGSDYELIVYGSTDCYYDVATSTRIDVDNEAEGSSSACWHLPSITNKRVESISFASTNPNAHAQFFYDDSCRKSLPVDHANSEPYLWHHPLPAGTGVSSTTNSNISVQREMYYISSVRFSAH